MKMKIKFTLLSLLLLCALSSFSQVGIGTTTPDPSSVLHISSTQKGTLITRMTSAQRDAISNPADGLMIYNTDSKCINIYKNANWWEVCGNCIPPAPPAVSNNGPVCSG